MFFCSNSKVHSIHALMSWSNSMSKGVFLLLLLLLFLFLLYALIRNEKQLRPSPFLISSSSFPIHFARLTLCLDHLPSACSTPFSLTHTSVIVGVFCSVLSEGGAWSNACFLLSSIERACVIVEWHCIRSRVYSVLVLEFLPSYCGVFAQFRRTHAHAPHARTHTHTHTSTCLYAEVYILHREKIDSWFNWRLRSHPLVFKDESPSSRGCTIEWTSIEQWSPGKTIWSPWTIWMSMRAWTE